MARAAYAAAVNVLLFLKPLDDDDDVENGREEQSGDFVDECDKCLNTVFVFDDEEEEEEHSNEDRSRRVILSREAVRREKARVVCISFSFQVRLCQMNYDVRFFEICFLVVHRRVHVLMVQISLSIYFSLAKAFKWFLIFSFLF